MKNIDVIKAFLNNERAKTANLWTDGAALVNYNTAIGHWHNGTLFVNTKKYSQSTSKIQNQLLKEANDLGLHIITTDNVRGDIGLVYFAIEYEG